MASITDTDIGIAPGWPIRWPFHAAHARYRLLRRRWHNRLWEAQMRRELGDDRLLADIGVPASVDRHRLAAMARALGASSQREI